MERHRAKNGSSRKGETGFHALLEFLLQKQSESRYPPVLERVDRFFQEGGRMIRTHGEHPVEGTDAPFPQIRRLKNARNDPQLPEFFLRHPRPFFPLK